MAWNMAGEAYFRVPGVVWTMTGARNSSAAAMMACTISMFSALNAPMA